MKTKTKTLVVTETVRYEFEVPASMAEDETTLKRYFGRQRDPWVRADFAAVTERDFVVEAPADLNPKPEPDEVPVG